MEKEDQLRAGEETDRKMWVTENKMERRMPMKFEMYLAESGRGDGQGDVEKEDQQSYRRPYMMGKIRGK